MELQSMGFILFICPLFIYWSIFSQFGALSHEYFCQMSSRVTFFRNFFLINQKKEHKNIPQGLEDILQIQFAMEWKYLWTEK